MCTGSCHQRFEDFKTIDFDDVKMIPSKNKTSRPFLQFRLVFYLNKQKKKEYNFLGSCCQKTKRIRKNSSSKPLLLRMTLPYYLILTFLTSLE